jgi:hypothetical protein
MIGIGNPLLDGPDARFASLAKQAQAKQRCPEQQQLAARGDHRASPARVETRGSLANVADIKGQVPLPETADELCAVAQDVKAQTGRDILLGAKATEREVKRLSAAGELAKYRMVHFATHGVLAGKLDGANEPGLILTPPGTATEEDDGYLSASEIATLKLDADLVPVGLQHGSGRGHQRGGALGLARAFIYAQARACWSAGRSTRLPPSKDHGVRNMARDPRSAGRSSAALDAGAHRQRRADEAHPTLGGVRDLGEGGRPVRLHRLSGLLCKKNASRPPRKAQEDWTAEFWKWCN